MMATMMFVKKHVLICLKRHKFMKFIFFLSLFLSHVHFFNVLFVIQYQFSNSNYVVSEIATIKKFPIYKCFQCKFSTLPEQGTKLRLIQSPMRLNSRAGDQESKVSRQVGDQNSLSFVYLTLIFLTTK